MGSYFPSTFGVLRSAEITDALFGAAELNKTDVMDFAQFGAAMMKLAEGRKMYESFVGFALSEEYKPWIQSWYCSERSRGDIAEEERKQVRIAKREEKEREKRMGKAGKELEGAAVQSEQSLQSGSVQLPSEKGASDGESLQAQTH